jgi:transcription termination/antitermination protein NusA
LEKIVDIANAIAYEKNLSPNDVKEAIKIALVKCAKNVVDEGRNFEAEFDEDKKNLRLYKQVVVVSDDDELLEEDPKNHISFTKAKEIDDSVEIGDELREELELEKYGRSIVNSMYKELEIELQKLLEDELYKKFSQKEGKIVSGQVVRVDPDGNTFIELDEIRAVLPRKNRIKNESFRVGEVVKSILKSINQKSRHGVSIELSRTTPRFLIELMTLEVPELAEGAIEIMKCARIPGKRAKVAILSNNPRVDPIGTAVGVKGVRINAVSKELKSENIDIIEYTETPELLVARAMAPAIIRSVAINDGIATVIVSEDQKSKAIGKDGINIRLASMLTGYEIRIHEDGTPREKGEETTEGTKVQSATGALSALFGA